MKAANLPTKNTTIHV
jgi:hypothetical protein